VHDHEHDNDHGHNHDHHAHTAAGLGDNRPRAAVQWQVPPDDAKESTPPAERDLDLVEASFAEGFIRAPDQPSFLRLASIPFVGVDAAGRRLHMLRVEIDHVTDVGAISPLLGGEGVRYDPLPATLVAKRRNLAFVYHDGRNLIRLSFAQARALRDESAASHFAIAQKN
jgi:hypothetical protein